MTRSIEFKYLVLCKCISILNYITTFFKQSLSPTSVIRLVMVIIKNGEISRNNRLDYTYFSSKNSITSKIFYDDAWLVYKPLSLLRVCLLNILAKFSLLFWSRGHPIDFAQKIENTPFSVIITRIFFIIVTRISSVQSQFVHPIAVFRFNIARESLW